MGLSGRGTLNASRSLDLVKHITELYQYLSDQNPIKELQEIKASRNYDSLVHVQQGVLNSFSEFTSSANYNVLINTSNDEQPGDRLVHAD